MRPERAADTGVKTPSRNKYRMRLSRNAKRLSDFFQDRNRRVQTAQRAQQCPLARMSRVNFRKDFFNFVG
jgi:hypothetical protein